MGSETPLHIIVTGQAAGGGLAALAGPALALAFPQANVDVITFGMPWTGFNPQFSWAFDQLVSLYYVWPFNSSDIVRIINATQHDPQQSLFDQAAMAGGRLVGGVEEEGFIMGGCGSPGDWTCWGLGEMGTPSAWGLGLLGTGPVGAG